MKSQIIALLVPRGSRRATLLVRLPRDGQFCPRKNRCARGFRHSDRCHLVSPRYAHRGPDHLDGRGPRGDGGIGDLAPVF